MSSYWFLDFFFKCLQDEYSEYFFLNVYKFYIKKYLNFI